MEEGWCLSYPKLSDDAGFVLGMETTPFQTHSYPIKARPQAWIGHDDSQASVPLVPRHMQRGFTEEDLTFICMLGAGHWPPVDLDPCLGTVLWAVGRVFAHLDAHVGVVGVSSRPQVLASSLGPQEVTEELGAVL